MWETSIIKTALIIRLLLAPLLSQDTQVLFFFSLIILQFYHEKICSNQIVLSLIFDQLIRYKMLCHLPFNHTDNLRVITKRHQWFCSFFSLSLTLTNVSEHIKISVAVTTGPVKWAKGANEKWNRQIRRRRGEDGETQEPRENV